nr:retrovirus-related Pol polyprotein from transposon TNT 1-94 [Tanacetum cinerariifolium]
MVYKDVKRIVFYFMSKLDGSPPFLLENKLCSLETYSLVSRLSCVQELLKNYQLLRQLVLKQLLVCKDRLECFSLRLHRLPEWSRFVTVVKQQHKLDEVSYHKLFDILKQYQNEVNELCAEKSSVPSPKPSIPSRSHTYTRHKGKEIGKSITPPSETASEEDNDPEQAQRDKDIQKNLALIAKYFKKIYKPTNNNLRTSSNSKNKNVDTTQQFKNDNQSGQFGNQRMVNVAAVRENVGSKVVQQSGIQCFNCKEYGHFAKECRKTKKYNWLADTDEKVDEQELEAHYSYMAKIQEVPNADSGIDSEPVEQVQNNAEYNVFANELQHSEQSEYVSNTCLVETDDRNVNPDSPDMCEDDIQNEQNDVESDDERVTLANLKLDVDENKKIQKQLKKGNTTLAQELKECKAILAETSKSLGESISVRDSFLVALQTKQTEFEKFDYGKLERKLNEALGQLAHKDTVIREGLKTKAYELSVVKEKHDELMKQSILTKSHYEGLESSVARQRHCNKDSVLGKPTTFSNSFVRKDFSKLNSVTQTNVSNDFSKPVTAQTLPPTMKSILKNMNVLALGMYKLHTDHNQTRTSQLPQDSRKTNKRVSFSKGVIPTTSVSRPQLKSNPIGDRFMRNNSQGKKQEVEDQRRNVKLPKNKTFVTACNDILNAKTLNVKYVSSMCDKCLSKPVTAQTLPQAARQAHMTSNLKLLCNFVEKFLGTVRFGNDQFALILGYRDLVQGNVTINRVYYVEGLNHNLFSVGQFCDADLEVAFRKSTCFVRDLQGNDLLTGNRGSDIHTISLQESTSSTPLCLMANATLTQVWLWYRRLSHLNFDYINLLLKKDIVIGLPKLKYVKDQLCSFCELSKTKRSSFKSKAVPSSKEG